MAEFNYLIKNTQAVKERIKSACASCGRKEDDVLLLAAVKYASADEINFIKNECGIRDVGENRVNTLLEHYALTENEKLRYHFIGTLQKNKVKYIYDKIFLLHSLDSLSLAEEIEKRCSGKGITLDCLIEINIADEESKSGISPKCAEEFARALLAFGHIKVKGFMTMAPAGCTPDEYNAYFSSAYSLMKEIWRKTLNGIGEPIISMGMSASLEVAIENGSTCVRIGSDIFKH